jgi:hypothetical protein
MTDSSKIRLGIYIPAVVVGLLGLGVVLNISIPPDSASYLVRQDDHYYYLTEAPIQSYCNGEYPVLVGERVFRNGVFWETTPKTIVITGDYIITELK